MSHGDLSYFTFKPDSLDDEEFRWEEKRVKQGFKRPVVIHRAIFGSLERFIALMTEHYAGKWPFWLSPRQVKICPISEKFNEYCYAVYKRLHKEGFQVELDLTSNTLNKKVRNAQLEQFNFVAVCGEEEANSGCVDVRNRDNVREGKFRVDQFIEKLKLLKPKDANQESEYYKEMWKDDLLGQLKDVPKEEKKDVKKPEKKEEPGKKQENKKGGKNEEKKN